MQSSKEIELCFNKLKTFTSDLRLRSMSCTLLVFSARMRYSSPVNKGVCTTHYQADFFSVIRFGTCGPYSGRESRKSALWGVSLGSSHFLHSACWGAGGNALHR